MRKIKENSVDSCISDFPYDLSFMGKKWDTTGNFYEWCKDRAEPLYRIIKPGGYVCIFGHPKTNHRMKSAFEDVGFNIVEEIDWVYGTGMPKNQDIGKLFDKKAGAEREVLNRNPNSRENCNKSNTLYQSGTVGKTDYITTPATDQAKKWNGWKTAGLKPAHEPITIFQKPMEKNYCYNIEKYNCGAMNIDACRIPLQETGEDPRLGGKGTWSTEKAAENIYCGGYAGERVSSSELGRFPANMIFDTYMGEELDNQSGISESKKSMRGVGYTDSLVFGAGKKDFDTERGFNDKGGASRFFLSIESEEFVPFYYCAKATKKEKGEGNTHVTVKPKALIKWLIKLVTPIDGKTIDITAGSGTHGLACEELNKDENYNLRWINIELLNTEKEPYCEIAMNRIKNVI